MHNDQKYDPLLPMRTRRFEFVECVLVKWVHWAKLVKASYDHHGDCMLRGLVNTAVSF